MLFTIAIQFDTENREYVNSIIEDFQHYIESYELKNPNFKDADIKLKIGGNSSMSEVCRSNLISHW